MAEKMDPVMEQVGELDKDEEIIGSYECLIDARRGYLVCSNKGVRFIHGGGRFENVFHKRLEVPYSEMDVGKEANQRLVLTIEGQPYSSRLEPLDTPLAELEKLLKPYVDIHGMPLRHMSDMRVNA